MLVRLSRCLGLVASLALLCSGCQCGLDTDAIDRWRCPANECDDGMVCEQGHCVVPECEVACGLGQTCLFGQCTCDDQGLVACADRCVRTSSDPADCGECGNACGEDQVCLRGPCASDCGGDLTNCGGSCVDRLSDRVFCGNCDTACAPDEVCLDGECQACNGPEDCEDGLDCTIDACTVGVCTNPLADDQCLIDGLCVPDGARNEAAPCQVCNGSVSARSWVESVSDGIECTVDSCVDGVPVHESDDGQCAKGQVCAPCAGGCVTPPGRLTVSCDDDRVVGGDPSFCDVALDAATDADCIHCEARAGMTELLREDFDACDLDGWEVTVTSGAGPICPLEVPGALFPGTGVDALEADNGNWSIERHVDTRDFNTVRLCFDYSERAADANSHFEVWVDETQVFADTSPVRQMVGNGWLTACLEDELGLGAAGNADLVIRFTLQSADNKDLYLDNIVLDGWVADDLPVRVLFEDDFTDCDLAAWTWDDTEPNCPTEGADDALWTGRDALEAMELTSHIWRRAAGAPPCEDPWLFFEYGNSNTDNVEALTVQQDVGAGWALAWGNSLGASPDNTFTPIRVGLAHVDPRARGATDLGVRFGMVATGGDRALAVDDVRLEAKECLPAGDRATLSAPAPITASTYTFVLSADEQITVHPVCT